MNRRRRESRVLQLVGEGDEVLRERCRKLSREEILSQEIQGLIDDIIYTSKEKKTGVGLSANQVGESVTISVIGIKPTPARPNLEVFDKVCINTEIVETFGDKELMWEGCLSTAKDENGEAVMGQVPRYKKIRIKYFDRGGEEQEEVVEGFVAHVMQHETDHLNGVLFTDFVDWDSLISYQDFMKMQS